jgi:hypothetical protein
MKKDSNTLVRYKVISPESLSATREYLEDMAGKGWMLKNIMGSFKFVFEKCEPKKVKFAVEIIPDGSVYDTHPSEKNEEYIGMCESIGWNYICTSTMFYVFYTEDMQVKDIESDEMLKFKTVKKAVIKSKFTNSIVCMVCGICMLLMAFTMQLNMTEASFLNAQSVLLWIVVLTVNTISISSKVLWMNRAKKVISSGGKMPEKKAASLKDTVIYLCIIALIHIGGALWYSIKFDDMFIGVFIPIVWLMIGVFGLVNRRITVIAEENKIGRNNNRALIIITSVVGTVVMINIVVCVMIFTSLGDSFAKGDKVDDFSEKELEMFGYSNVFESREIDKTVMGRFLMDYTRYEIVAKNKYSVLLDENGETKSMSEKEGEEFLPIEYEWSIDVYHSENEKIIARLIREARQDKTRAFGVWFDFDTAVKIDNDKLNVYENTETDYEDDEDENGDYQYLIYDDNNIVWMRCDEKINDAQLDMIQEKFF